MKPRILILSFSVIYSDPRVMRQVRLLEDFAELTVAGYGAAPDAICEFISLPKFSANLMTKAGWSLKLLLGQFECYYWQRPEVRTIYRQIDGRTFDLIIANDIASLPVALKLANDTPVLMDAHEYSPSEFDDKLMWRILFGRYHDYLCRTYLPQAAAMTTVCMGIADAYHANYGVFSSVVMNSPTYSDQRPSNIEVGKVRMIHHGAAIRSRNLELMIDVMGYLDQRFSLDLMLVENDITYMRDLRARAASDPRIRFVPPVRMEAICSIINAYDVGIYLLPPVNFNHQYALPNKIFEFVQARLAIAIGPSPEMMRIVQNYGLGVVAKSFKPVDFASELTNLANNGLLNYKMASHEAARELSYERSAEIFLKEINTLLDKPTATKC